MSLDDFATNTNLGMSRGWIVKNNRFPPGPLHFLFLPRISYFSRAHSPPMSHAPEAHHRA